MESRFQHDFSAVRVHTDARAAESAQTVDALAYSAGPHLVFGAGQYAPQTRDGHRLLAHELTHVVQQKSIPTETSSSTVFRKVGKVNCPPNVFGAPADPKTALETVDPIAVAQATQAADALATDAEDTKGGIPAAPSVTFASYRNHFGLPVAAGKGFLNRLTGAVRPSQAIAASEELRILSRRFRFSARLLNQTVNYRCPGTATFTLPGCAPGSSCGTSFALSCRGGSTVALCQPFWDQLTSDDTKAAALVHESMHIILGPGGGGALEQGAIGETTQKGSGRNFNIAGCYEFIVNDMLGINSFPVCPAVPP